MLGQIEGELRYNYNIIMCLDISKKRILIKVKLLLNALSIVI